jgi:hypothetical protein
LTRRIRRTRLGELARQPFPVTDQVGHTEASRRRDHLGGHVAEHQLDDVAPGCHAGLVCLALLEGHPPSLDGNELHF